MLSPRLGPTRMESDVKMVLGLFDELFGTPDGNQLRQWCAMRGWALVWALGQADAGDAAGINVLKPFLHAHTSLCLSLSLSLVAHVVRRCSPPHLFPHVRRQSTQEMEPPLFVPTEKQYTHRTNGYSIRSPRAVLGATFRFHPVRALLLFSSVVIDRLPLASIVYVHYFYFHVVITVFVSSFL